MWGLAFHCFPHEVGKPNPKMGPCTNAREAWLTVSTISRFPLILYHLNKSSASSAFCKALHQQIIILFYSLYYDLNGCIFSLKSIYGIYYKHICYLSVMNCAARKWEGATPPQKAKHASKHASKTRACTRACTRAKKHSQTPSLPFPCRLVYDPWRCHGRLRFNPSLGDWF